MNLRIALLSLAEHHRLSPAAGQRLRELAGFDKPPRALRHYLPIGMSVLGAALAGLGLVFWVAANWDALPRAGRFALLETGVAAALLGAWRFPVARMPLSLLGFLACGGLFAFFGQTYQTGADPWQLFALWAALTLPLCLGVRHDVLWTAWVMVALTAAELYAQVQTNRFWWWSDRHISLLGSLGAWLPSLLLALALKLVPTQLTGAGAWPVRVSMIYATIGLVGMSVRIVFRDTHGNLYLLSLLIVAVLFACFSRRRWFDIFVLSALGLGANVLLVCGLGSKMLGTRGSELGALLLIACASAALLAATVKLIVRIARAHGQEDVA